MIQNAILTEVIEKENRKRIQQEAENARYLRLSDANSAEDSKDELVILEKLAQVRGRLSAAIRPLRWSFR